MKWIDIPPVWTLLFLIVVWCIAAWQPNALVFHVHFLDIMLLLAAFGLTLGAVLTLRRHKTTVIPHMQASTLVTSGVFAISRNPIYLADACLLAGFAFLLGAPIAVLLVPFLMRILTQRFILPEEAGLQANFPESFAAYTKTTRRWV